MIFALSISWFCGVLAKFFVSPFWPCWKSQSIIRAFENAEATNRRADEKWKPIISELQCRGKVGLSECRQRSGDSGQESWRSIDEPQMVVQAQKEIERNKPSSYRIKGSGAWHCWLREVLEKELSERTWAVGGTILNRPVNPEQINETHLWHAFIWLQGSEQREFDIGRNPGDSFLIGKRTILSPLSIPGKFRPRKRNRTESVGR